MVRDSNHDSNNDSKETLDVDPWRFNVSNKEIAGEYVMKKEDREQQEMWMQLNQPRNKLANESKTIQTSFGQVRRDSMNVVRFHGQFDFSSSKPAFDVKDYESLLLEKINKLNTTPVVSQSSSSAQDVKDKTVESVSQEELDSLFPKRTTFNTSSRHGLGTFDFEFSKEWIEIVESSEADEATIEEYRRQRKLVEQRQQQISILEGLHISQESPLKSVDDVSREIQEMRAEQELAEQSQPEAVKEEESSETKVEEEDDDKPKTYEDLAGQEMSAYEFVKGLRRGKIESKDEKLNQMLKECDTSNLDSKGFQSYKNYVIDLTKIRRSELLWLLKKNIIFCDSGILAINKPYGLIVQGKLKKDEASNHEPVLTELLDEFSDLLLREGILKEKPDKIHPVHRLDKESTGVLVLATTVEKAHKLQQLFEKKEVIKKYLALTRGVPDNDMGIIDIPMEVGSVEGKERMVLRPEVREELRRIVSPSKMAKRAVTQYKIISSRANCALLEVSPETGVKHQIRVHLGFGLRTPILGDHKYTYLERIAPQRLPSDMLTCLNIRPSKVRNIPMHLHSLTTALPGAGEGGRNVFLRAHIPQFFQTTMKKLKLTY